MAGPKIATRREQFGARADNAQEQGRADLARAINRCPFLSPKARAISVQLTGERSTTINHGLGVPAAFFVMRPNYDGNGNGHGAQIVEAASQAGIDINNQLNVRASTSCVVDLWFYPRASQPIPTGAIQTT